MKSLDKSGSQDLTYLALQQQISDELLNIRFTAKTIERLCDSVRHMVEQVRSHERHIPQLCVDRAGMPRRTSSRSSRPGDQPSTGSRTRSRRARTTPKA